ncbi:DUF3597 domain-containing protein [Sphingomonas sanxanigenens]|uniref:DUF3597 domain-containing protein n=1 Tax=Sphingomonas sanxanigenens DSM 19645 = NX02 TaxID=1123269 RepID=W0AEH7_9SPHN|nr:DUF3597 domain-containing protein [Sphingomonas sanxanigenens]AHE56319.1 hypothetical protein NX02_23525 [Sphingomonas sanxanigenens DSM 19645 = NX02]
MSVFGKIRDVIFGKKAEPAKAPAPAAKPAVAPPPAAAAPKPAAAPVPASAPAQPVDVEAVLHQIWLDKGSPKSNYKVSIVDLMMLLDLDSSLANRKELATELGYAGAKDGSAEMNIWLHKQVMRELARNGGKVPAALTD